MKLIFLIFLKLNKKLADLNLLHFSKKFSNYHSRLWKEMACLCSTVLIQYERWGYKLIQSMIWDFILLVDYSSFIRNYFLSLPESFSYKIFFVCLLNDSSPNIISHSWTEAHLLLCPLHFCLEIPILTLEVEVFVRYPEMF